MIANAAEVWRRFHCEHDDDDPNEAHMSALLSASHDSAQKQSMVVSVHCHPAARYHWPGQSESRWQPPKWHRHRQRDGARAVPVQVIQRTRAARPRASVRRGTPLEQTKPTDFNRNTQK